MKKIVRAFLGILLLSMFFGCQPAKAASTIPCDEIASLAEAIMAARQAGVPMREMYKAADAHGDDSEFFKSMVKSLVKQSFTVPRYSTEGFKKTAITDFGSTVFMECIRKQ